MNKQVNIQLTTKVNYLQNTKSVTLDCNQLVTLDVSNSTPKHITNNANVLTKAIYNMIEDVNKRWLHLGNVQHTTKLNGQLISPENHLKIIQLVQQLN